MLDKIVDQIRLEGFDDAIIGISDAGAIIYDLDLMVEVFAKDIEDEDAYDQALEYIDFNVLNLKVPGIFPLIVKIINNG
jgi:hypothetical protein